MRGSVLEARFCRKLFGATALTGPSLLVARNASRSVAFCRFVRSVFCQAILVCRASSRQQKTIHLYKYTHADFISHNWELLWLVASRELLQEPRPRLTSTVPPLFVFRQMFIYNRLLLWLYLSSRIKFCVCPATDSAPAWSWVLMQFVVCERG